MAAHSSQVAALAHKFQAVDFPAAEPVVDANPGWTCKKKPGRGHEGKSLFPEPATRSLFASPDRHRPTNQFTSLNVIVETELIWMRTQSHGIDFLDSLVGNPLLHHVFGKDITLEQELVVCFQGIQRRVERSRCLGY